MLHQSVTPLVAAMEEMAELFRVEQPEIDQLEDRLTNLARQFCIKTATYGLKDWEQEFGVQEDSRLTDEQRRAKLLGLLNTQTPASVLMLENLVQQILQPSGVTIIEHPAEYRFDIYVDTDYLIDNMLIADEAVRQARPAHLDYTFINHLQRTGKKILYVGIGGVEKKRVEGEVDIDGLFFDG